MNERAQGLDLIRFPAATLGAIHRALREELGEKRAARVLYGIGTESGVAFYSRFRIWLSESGSGSLDPESLTVDEFWTRLSAFFGYLGWGHLEATAGGPGILTLELNEWVEARQSGPSPGCPVTAGLISEVLRQVAGGDLAAVEVASSAADDGRSRVVVGHAKSLDALLASIGDGDEPLVPVPG